MLFFKTQNTIRYQTNFFVKEIRYKLYKMLIIFLKWNKQLGKIITKIRKPIYFKNTCIFTARAKSLSRKLKISRILIRELSSKGFYFGLHKLAW